MYDRAVIRRLYVHNFRCLENFELPISDGHSTLLIGKNGAGKTAISHALEVLQKIARGTNRVGELVRPKDLTSGRADVPMRFELSAELGGTLYEYVLALECPAGFKELRVLDEKLSLDGKALFTRKDREATFAIDQHLVALPIVQLRSTNQPTRDPLFVFKEWLARMLILRPMPTLIGGDSTEESTQPVPEVTDFGAWFAGILAERPSSYRRIAEYLTQVMPDFKDIQKPVVGKESRSLVVQFADGQRSVTLPFADLSDGEKCFMICALVLASAEGHSLVCFWDEPDNYLALDEVGHFVMALRTAFQSSGQFIATSHNPETIRRFSDENTIVLQRKSHFEPTVARRLSELKVPGDLIGALIRGDVES